MSTKGTAVLVNPEALIPAVTIIRMSNRQLESQAMVLRGEAKEMLEGGVMEGERMTGQKEAIETIVTSCDQLSKLFADLSTATGHVYDKYIDAERKQAIDSLVASHLETLNKKGNRDALRKK